ncbi:polyprenyl diphosphate synthase [Gemmatimonadales bacterium]|nr:polyprenyl diphosphate synthase [Gemmatimonadales bacterium]
MDTLHVAIIMDGNGRWATARGRPRSWGHRQGAEAARKIIQVASTLGISTLTLYAFSSDNWQRPQSEVSLLMKLFRQYLRSEVDELRENGVRLTVVGRRDRLEPGLIEDIEKAEKHLSEGTRLELRLAVDYSSRNVMLEAVRAAAGATNIDLQGLSGLIGEAMNGKGRALDVDLLIRTGGERRLSDFLLWESAYAELYFTAAMWPEFGVGDLATAITDYHARERRFGRVAVAS